MSRDELTRMDVDTGFLYHRKTRALQVANPERWPIYYTAYLAVLAESWKKGTRLTLADSWSVAFPCTMDEALAALVSVELLDAAGRIRVGSWKEWVEPALERIGKKSAAGKTGATARWEKERARGTSTKSAPDGNAKSMRPDATALRIDAPRQPSTPSTPATPASAPEAVVLEQEADALDAWFRLTGSWPSLKVRPWLEELARNHGDAAVERALAEEAVLDGDRKTLLSRTSSRLDREEHEASKRRDAAATEAAAAERLRVASMTDEQRAANMERLGSMLRQSGILPAEGTKP
jgi:hypothetical protein